MPGRDLISQRARQFDSSGIRKIFDLAAKLKDPIDLSIGQADYDVPEEVKASAIKAIQNGGNKYTATQGLPKLIDGLYAKLEPTKEPGRRVFITTGVSGGLFLSLAACINAGDEIIMPDPFFVTYFQGAKFFGGVPVPVNTYPDFRMTAERIEKYITPKTKMIIVGTPSNPTGAALTKKEMLDIAALADKHEIVLVSDEIYNTFYYDSAPVGMAPLSRKAIVLGGFSKSHGAPGWRIGYAFGPNEIIEQMVKMQQYSFICAPAPLQYAIQENLNYDTKHITDTYRKKRDFIYNGLKDKFEVTRPEGSFYLFPKAPWGKGSEFCEEAIKNNLLIIPGTVFSMHDTHFRISYAASDRTLERGVEVLNRLAGRKP